MSPRRINQAVKASMRQNSINYEGSRESSVGPTRWRNWRRIPVPRLAARIGLAPYMGLATPYRGELQPSCVDIPLRQHIGAPSTPLVKVGDMVARGDCIGEIPQGALGARVHAGISGRVEQVDDSVRIRATA